MRIPFPRLACSWLFVPILASGPPFVAAASADERVEERIAALLQSVPDRFDCRIPCFTVESLVGEDGKTVHYVQIEVSDPACVCVLNVLNDISKTKDLVFIGGRAAGREPETARPQREVFLYHRGASDLTLIYRINPAMPCVSDDSAGKTDDGRQKRHEQASTVGAGPAISRFQRLAGGDSRLVDSS